MGKEKLKIPVWEKMNLTIEEAAAYSNIGINKIDDMAKSPGCPFVLYIGRKKLIKRKEFEKYIEKSLEIQLRKVKIFRTKYKDKYQIPVK